MTFENIFVLAELNFPDAIEHYNKLTMSEQILFLTKLTELHQQNPHNNTTKYLYNTLVI